MNNEIPFVQFFDFLEPHELQQLLSFVDERHDHLAPSSVYRSASDPGVVDEKARRSRVEMDTAAIRPIFQDRLVALLPHMRKELGIGRFDLGELETQLTVHGDGDFFGCHRDEHHPGTDGSRAVTFVFYFHAEPREFEGGTLRLGSVGVDDPIDDRIEIEPVNNSIVFFAADVDHEVTPIRTTGSGPGSLRCTFNGWFRIGKGSGPAVPMLTRAAAAVVHKAVVPRVTRHGFTVRATPPSVHRRLVRHWADHGDLAVAEGEISEYFPGGAPDLIEVGALGIEILHELLGLHEAWAGVELEPISAYGLRNYRADQRIAMHVDRGESHIITSELQVAQALDQPWPLTIDLDDQRHEIHLQPGHMITYEGASCPNGRPGPLRGSGFCSLLLHYRPIGWDLTSSGISRAGLERGLIDVAGNVDLDVVGSAR